MNTDPFEQLQIKRKITALYTALHCLPLNEREILEYRFGIGKPFKTLRELELILGIPYRHISCRESKILRKLRSKKFRTIFREVL